MAGEREIESELDGELEDGDGQIGEAEDETPGQELFGDVVGHDGARGAPAMPGTGESVQLRDSVAGVYEVVKDLEVQLNHMVSINEAAERDLETSRKAQRELERERGDLKRRIERMELDGQSSAELREELRHMTQENERLIEKLRASEAKTDDWEAKRRMLLDGMARAEVERDELRDEVDCLEEQIHGVSLCVGRLREELARAREARAQQSRKTDLVEQRLHVVTQERDALRQELNESRSALEEIKRSIMDTNMQSQLTYYES